jgi:hypothetical protein
MSWAAKLAILLIAFSIGGAGGIKWQLGVQARATLAAADIAKSDAKQQQHLGDQAATNHAAALVAINQKLGDQRAYIAKLSGRDCLGAGTVGLLNGAGGEPVPAAASDPARAATAAATGAGLRFATEHDVAAAIAICRAGYAGLSSQLNQILDIEEARHP